MSDSSLTRQLAGSAFKRADTLRDERRSEASRPVEDFLRNLAGWLPPERESAASIRRLSLVVDLCVEGLRGQSDAAVAAGFHRAVQVLKTGRNAVHDLKHLPTVLACIAEACRRRLGLWPHPVQLAGARVLLAGKLAEMQTGEGKTLVAAMAATAMAGAGASVHVISTNDYLARRDCEEMAPLFNFFGLGAGYVAGGMQAEQRRSAYAHPVCYAAGKELVFDYLRDRLQGHGVVPVRVSQLRDLMSDAVGARPAPLIPALHFAIVDEADSVLIDEARTPMILSRESPPLFAPELLAWAIAAAGTLRAGVHFKLGAGRELDLLPGAVDHCPAVPAGLPGVWQARTWRELLLRQALTALHLYHRDQHYILTENKVQIVDESTGRVMPDRSWEQGLHQMIETKEGVPVSQGRETLERMTYQRFFRRYYLVSGLTGTAAESSRELWAVYRLKVRRIPPDKPNRRTRMADRCEASLNAKWAAVADEAAARAAQGQPVLVGTRSVQASEQIAAELNRRGVPHVVLNARQDAEEAAIVAQAGEAGRITVATNMAGRGTDIKPDSSARQVGGLHVLLTEFHESPRIDRQLFGRSGRQGEPGSARAIICTQDVLFTHVPGPLRSMMCGADGGGLRQWCLRWLVRRAQARAERRAYQVRLQTMRQDKELHRLIGFAGRVI